MLDRSKDLVRSGDKQVCWLLAHVTALTPGWAENGGRRRWWQLRASQEINPAYENLLLKTVETVIDACFRSGGMPELAPHKPGGEERGWHGCTSSQYEELNQTEGEDLLAGSPVALKLVNFVGR